MAASHVTPADERGPVVTLNHFFVVVDAPSYEAARTSAFLTREFAPFEARTTVRNDKSYTGIYWYGRSTYFELFEPGDQGPAGASGLALGVEEPGASALVKQRWEAALGRGRRGLVTRKTETDEVPWFEMTYAREIPGLRVWLMEYHRDFLARWYGSLTPARSITRAEVLDRYVAKIGQSDRRDTALLKDVVGPDDRPRPGRARDAREAASRRRLDRHGRGRAPSSAAARSRSGFGSSHRRAGERASSKSSSRCSTRSRSARNASAALSCSSKASLPGCS